MKKANPKAVGGFVIGAVILASVAVIIFGSGRIFQQTEKYVSFFKDSLQGLRVGAPVQFRGVQIGTVSQIFVQFDAKKLNFFIPVVLEIDPAAVQDISEEDEADVGDINILIEQGLRAQLAVQSFVTGQQVVQLFMRPDTPVELVKTDLPYEQIPTIPSTFAQVEQSIGGVLNDAGEILADFKDFIGKNRGAIEETLANISETTVDAQATMADLRIAAGHVTNLTETVSENREAIVGLVHNANDTLLSYKSLAEHVEAIVTANEEDLSQAIAGLRQLEEEMSALAATTQAVLEENRAGLQDFTNEGLFEIKNLAIDTQAAVEQFRRVMEELERDPARFLLGQPGQVEVN